MKNSNVKNSIKRFYINLRKIVKRANNLEALDIIYKRGVLSYIKVKRNGQIKGLNTVVTNELKKLIKVINSHAKKLKINKRWRVF